jgi:hypothetical protein
MYIYLSIYLYIYLSIYICVCLSVCQPLSQFVGEPYVSNLQKILNAETVSGMYCNLLEFYNYNFVKAEEWVIQITASVIFHFLFHMVQFSEYNHS